MKRASRLAVAGAMIAATLALAAPQGAGASDSAPPWVRHVRNWPGGISNGVRAYLDPGVESAQAKFDGTRSSGSRAVGTPLENVQMNSDSTPPMPQDETSVAYNPHNPMIAVAGANDYVSNGLAIMRTTDGGRHWSTFFQTPQFFPFRASCTGSDPAVEYSVRDRAFYMATLCFFRTQAESEVQIWKSVDNGETWTPTRLASVAASNFNRETGETDASVFLDKEYITIDNNPGSPFFGRIYVTYIKFHIDVNDPFGRSDFCPAQLAYTDEIPTQNPQLAVWQHTPVVPDPASGFGPKGETANQWAYPQVESDGDLDITYALEDCNSSRDRHLKFQKSSDGGASFLPKPVQIDKPGQFRDNPDLGDVLPPTFFRAPISPGFDVNKATGTLTYMYQNHINAQDSGADISVQFSYDGGFHWTDAQFLARRPDGGPAKNDQFFPWVDSDEAGNIFAIWFDRRRDPNNHDIDTWQAESFNDGASFDQYRISTQSWDPDKGFFFSGAFIGDYNAIAASNAVVYPVWTDGRNTAYDPPPGLTLAGETDIFTNVEIRP